MTTPTPALTAAQLIDEVRSRYGPPEWHVEEEMTLLDRRLDLVAFNLWGARSYRVVGFEVKVARGDWLRELADFQKAEEWLRVVDAFYVVTPPKLVRADELPAGWGHLELVGARMKTRAYPAKRPVGRELPRELVARLFSRTMQRQSTVERTAEYHASERLRQEIREQLAARHEEERKYDREELAALRGELATIYELAGIPPKAWDARQQALRAAHVLAEFRRDGQALRTALERATAQLGRHHSQLQEALAALELPEASPCGS